MSEFWPFWWGGLAVGAVATLYPLASGRLLGVSSLYAALFEKRSAEPRVSLSELEAALRPRTSMHRMGDDLVFDCLFPSRLEAPQG